MSISIFNNTASRSLASYVSVSFLSMYSSLGKLSSGNKLNSAADGPAELVISEQLRSQIASLNQEIKNTSSLINKYDTASSTLSELRSNLNNLRSIAVGAANEGGNNDSAQQAYDTTGGYLVSYYNDVLDDAEYNGSKLFDGSEGSLSSISQLEGIDLSSAPAAENSIEKIDAAMAELDSAQTEIGATQKNELESSLASLQITQQNLQAAESSIRDTDYVLELTNLLSAQIKAQAGLSLMTHLAISSRSVLSLLNSD